jgi:hypothetical protein
VPLPVDIEPEVDDVVLLVVLLVLLDGLVDEVEVDGLVEVDVDMDGLVEVDVEVDGLLRVDELLVVLVAVVLLMVTIEEQSSRFAPIEADALPTPLTLPETPAEGEALLQVMRTWSPLLRSLRTAAALESTVSVRLLDAPAVAAAGFRVMVRAL